jgi:hypothetical protein
LSAADRNRAEPNASPLRQAIESNSRQLNLTRLIRERKKVRAVSMETLERILCQAIANIVLSGDLDPLLDHQALEERTKNELRRLMRDAQEGKAPGADADREALRQQIGRLEEELERQQRELATEKELTPEEVQEREIDRLQRRIHKLNRALQASEDAMRQLAEAKSIDPGVASVYDGFQGLASDDTKYLEKLEMIQVVFVNNLRLKNREVTADDLRGVRDDYLLDVPPASTASAGAAARRAADGDTSQTGRRGRLFFRKPVDPVIDETSF